MYDEDVHVCFVGFFSGALSPSCNLSVLYENIILVIVAGHGIVKEPHPIKRLAVLDLQEALSRLDVCKVGWGR